MLSLVSRVWRKIALEVSVAQYLADVKSVTSRTVAKVAHKLLLHTRSRIE